HPQTFSAFLETNWNSFTRALGFASALVVRDTVREVRVGKLFRGASAQRVFELQRAFMNVRLKGRGVFTRPENTQDPIGDWLKPRLWWSDWLPNEESAKPTQIENARATELDFMSAAFAYLDSTCGRDDTWFAECFWQSTRV